LYAFMVFELDFYHDFVVWIRSIVGLLVWWFFFLLNFYTVVK